MFLTNKEVLAEAARTNSSRAVDGIGLLIRASTTDGKLNKKKLLSLYRGVKQAIIDRRYTFRLPEPIAERTSYGDNYQIRECQISKWTRPWHVVPELKNFRPPVGDYGVGVEVEYGFASIPDAQHVAYHMRNWKHVALDWEGGAHGIETTFPPVLYSKLNNKSQCFRYLKYLASIPNRLYNHAPDRHVGTHINVSARNTLSPDRMTQVSRVLVALPEWMKVQYFGRNPYGYGYHRQRMIEWKLFNSVTDHTVLARYINIAVSLTKLVESDIAISEGSVIAALEAGYRGRV